MSNVKRRTTTTKAPLARSKSGPTPVSHVRKVSAESASMETIPKPLYSYTEFKPSPVVVYTRNMEEADELVQTLKGYDTSTLVTTVVTYTYDSFAWFSIGL